MRAPAPDTARAWKDHRRTCERCDLSQPGCDEGYEIFEQHCLALQHGGASGSLGNAFAGSRMGTAFVWGFWFTIGAGLAAAFVGLLWIVLWVAILAALLGEA